jgi:hypothetical protein
MVGHLVCGRFFKPKPPTLTAEERIQLGLESEPAAVGKDGKPELDKDGKPVLQAKKSPRHPKI